LQEEDERAHANRAALKSFFSWFGFLGKGISLVVAIDSVWQIIGDGYWLLRSYFDISLFVALLHKITG
jgi:hypothetical protein